MNPNHLFEKNPKQSKTLLPNHWDDYYSNFLPWILVFKKKNQAQSRDLCQDNDIDSGFKRWSSLLKNAC